MQGCCRFKSFIFAYLILGHFGHFGNFLAIELFFFIIHVRQVFWLIFHWLQRESSEKSQNGYFPLLKSTLENTIFLIFAFSQASKTVRSGKYNPISYFLVKLTPKFLRNFFLGKFPYHRGPNRGSEYHKIPKILKI